MHPYISYHIEKHGVLFLNDDLAGLTHGYASDPSILHDAMTIDQALAAVEPELCDVSDLSDLSLEELESLTKWLHKHGAYDLALLITKHMI